MRALIAATALVLCALPAEAKIVSEAWGAMPSGEAVDLYTLTNARGAEARITTYGGVLVSLKMPDRDGVYGDVVQGYDSLADYLSPAKGGSYGALLGRYANRIKDAKFTLDGTEVQLMPSGGGNSVHGGPVGFGKRVWRATPRDGRDPSLTLELVSADGDQGFPGTMHATVTYTLTGSTLRIEYRATTDKPTVANLSNHSFFNLRHAGDIKGYEVQLFADQYTPAGTGLVPTGEIASVDGTAFDLRQPAVIGPRLDSNDPQIQMAHGYDHNIVIRGRPGTLRRAVRVHDPVSGRTVESWTTQPGMQFYTSNTAKVVTGGGGAQFGPYTAICLEMQHYPNSPNQPEFPSTVVRPGKPLHEVTEYRFSAQ
jgi:aldose 1-epimerase